MHSEQSLITGRLTASLRRFLGSLLATAAVSVSPAAAATYTWTGTTSALWTNTTNWNPTSGTPGVADGAVFNAAGNGNTTIDLSGTSTVLSVLFDTATAAGYTIGSGGAANQTLRLASSGTVAMTSTVANDQLINALLVLGTNAAAGSFTLSNNSLTNNLTFAGGITGGSGGTAGAKTLTVGGAGATAISGTISNGGATSLSLVKSGLGTLTLTNANTYTGSTSITSGMLQIGNGGTAGSISSSSALTLGNAGLVMSRSDSATQSFASTTLNAGRSTVAAGASNTINFGAITRNLGSALDIPTTGSFITSTGNTNSILGSGITYGGTTWAVANGSSAITGLSSYTLASTAGSTAASYTNANIDIDNSQSPAAAITPNSLRFNTAGATTFTLPAALSTVSNGILVTANVGNNGSTITGGTIAGSSGGDLVVIQNNTANTLTLNSAIANNSTATGLTKSGLGTLVLGTGNTYTGTTAILQGTVRVTSATNSLGNGTGGVVLLNGGTIDLAWSNAQSSNWAIQVGANGGTLLLSNSNTQIWQANTNFGGGTLTVLGGSSGNGFRTASGLGGTGKTVINNAKWDYAAFRTTGDDALTVTNNAALAAFGATFGSATQGITVGTGTNYLTPTGGGSSTIAAKLSGTNSASALQIGPNLAANGQTAYVTISNTANSYVGDFQFVVRGPSTPSATGAGVRLGASEVIPDGEGKGTVLVYSGTLSTSAMGSAVTFDLNGFSETINGLSSLNPTSGTYSTNSVVDNMLASSTSTLTLGGNNATSTFAGRIQNSGSSAILNLTKIGTGTQTLSGSNSYSGSTTVSAGELALGRASAIGTGTSTVNGGVLNISTYAPSVAGFTITSGSLVGTGTLTATNGYALQGGAVNAGLGSGAITVSNGTTSLGSAGRFNSNSVLTISSGQLTLGGNESVSGFTLTGGILGGSGGALTSAAAFDVRSGSVLANLAGSASLTKSTAGTVTLSGSNGYTGATAISGGRLTVESAGSLNGTSGITLNGGDFKYNSATALAPAITFAGAGGTLSGTGTIGSAVTVGTNAVLSPGNSPGTQAFTSGLAWNPGGTYVWELNSLSGTAGTNWDLLAVSGGALDISGLSTGGKFNLNLVTLNGSNAAGPLDSGYVAGSSYEFLITSFATLGSGTNNFGANSNLTSLFNISLTGWQGPQPSLSDISVKVNAAGNGIQLVIVPEPGTVVFAGFGIVMAGWSLWKRRRGAHTP
ncbi:MAG: autotransporter-associated beta strand repeat-containing protein [Planctomycetia bacterium]|nr:autotransporter-associated beta strand repeat-containing protein [Planctomycetia bacterium]